MHCGKSSEFGNREAYVKCANDGSIEGAARSISALCHSGVLFPGRNDHWGTTKCPSVISHINTYAEGLVRPNGLVEDEAVFLHLLVEGCAVDIEHSRGFLTIPVERTERLEDEPFLRLLECFLQG